MKRATAPMPTAYTSFTIRDVGPAAKRGGNGTLIARTEETKPTVAMATRAQSYLTHSRTIRIIASRSFIAVGVPLATCHKAAFRGQKAETVKIKVTRIIAADSINHTRYFQGVFHPLINPPKAATSNAAELGMKNSPVSTGYCGP